MADCLSEEYLSDEVGENTVVQYFLPKKRRNDFRPKVTVQNFWTDQNTSKLIAAVKTQRAIWQVSCEDFKMRAKKEIAWQAVHEIFDDDIVGVDELCAKWQNLRTSYRRSKMKLKELQAKQIYNSTPVWRFHNEMLFLEENKNEAEDKSQEETASQEEEEMTRPIPKRSIKRKIVDSSYWSDKNVVKLIAAVKKQHLIWDLKHKSFKDRDARESAWQIIDDAFEQKIPINQLAAKWQSLRSQYRTNKNLLRKSGAHQPITWKFYRYMTFLDADENEAIEDELSEESAIKSESYEQAHDIGKYEDLKDEDTWSEPHPSSDPLPHSSSDPLPEPEEESDNVAEFASFFISELRKIKSQAYREATQRKVLHFLWQCMDEEPNT